MCVKGKGALEDKENYEDEDDKGAPNPSSVYTKRIMIQSTRNDCPCLYVYIVSSYVFSQRLTLKKLLTKIIKYVIGLNKQRLDNTLITEPKNQGGRQCFGTWSAFTAY